jgi:hypothetical protein
MARRSYGRSRRKRRQSLVYRWRYLIGLAGLIALVLVFWPEDTGPEEAVPGSTPESANTAPEAGMSPGSDAVMQAGEFAAPVTENTAGSGTLALTMDREEPQAALEQRDAPPVVPVRDYPVNARVDQVVQAAMATFKENPNSLVEVRTELNDLLREEMSEQQRNRVRQVLGGLAEKWLMTRYVYAGDDLCETYEVQPGDRLQRIGYEYKVPYEILMRINHITSAPELKAGAKIKVVKGPFHARVSRTTFTMDLYLQKTFVKSYRVGLGMRGSETPTGAWLVKPGDKMIRPQWTDKLTGRVYHGDDPDYPLGSRWIGLQGIEGAAVGRTGFAIHGTKDPETIGTQSSQGCIRLHNQHVEEVYAVLLDGVSRVLVFD